jgi:hypothetical protein
LKNKASVTDGTGVLVKIKEREAAAALLYIFTHTLLLGGTDSAQQLLSIEADGVGGGGELPLPTCWPIIYL